MPLITKLQTGGRQRSGGLINHSQKRLEQERCKKSQSWHFSMGLKDNARWCILFSAQARWESRVDSIWRLNIIGMNEPPQPPARCVWWCWLLVYHLSNPDLSSPLSSLPLVLSPDRHTLHLIFLSVMATLKYLATSKYQTFEYYWLAWPGHNEGW